MRLTEKRPNVLPEWLSEEPQIITFRSRGGSATGVLKEVRWGLVWRDFILEDGRVIPEHKVDGSPQPQAWRNAADVSEEERRECEERLLSMASSGMDPRKRDQLFWAELNQYLAYTYLRFKKGTKPECEE